VQPGANRIGGLTTMTSLEVDTVVFGGGIAGLWVLDALSRRNMSAVLLESRALGSGQTCAAQGIIHGGLKYTLDGLLTSSAETISGMPDLWRDCLSGRRDPDLSGAILCSPHCYLWRTTGLRSRFGLIGAKVGLNVRPVKLPPDEWPAALRACPGDVFRLDEPVVDPLSVVAALAEQHRRRVLLIGDAEHVDFEREGDVIRSIRFPRSGGIDETQGDSEITFCPRVVVFAAGSGNEALRSAAGLEPGAMQRRPLHMVLVRGALPQLNGHCTDAATTRATITSATDAGGRTVWQVGGQIAEDGVAMEPAALLHHARRELSEILPSVDFAGAEWAAYRVDRAEGSTRDGKRPSDVQVRLEGNVLTAWPTKLALAPKLADRIVELLVRGNPTPGSMRNDTDRGIDWPPPPIARPPWEEEQSWTADL